MMPKQSLRSICLTAVAAAVVAIVSAAPAGAAPPLAGSGTGLITADQVTSARNAGGNRIVERLLEGSMSGTLTGSISEDVRGVVHHDGTVTFQGTLVFVGTVDGCGTGTLTARLQGNGQALPPVTDATVTVIDQAANTVRVTGHGTVLQSGPDLSYSIRYSCH